MVQSNVVTVVVNPPLTSLVLASNVTSLKANTTADIYGYLYYSNGAGGPSGVLVTLTNSNGTQTTATTGTGGSFYWQYYNFPTPGTYSLTAQAAGLTSNTITISVLQGPYLAPITGSVEPYTISGSGLTPGGQIYLAMSTTAQIHENNPAYADSPVVNAGTPDSNGNLTNSLNLYDQLWKIWNGPGTYYFALWDSNASLLSNTQSVYVSG